MNERKYSEQELKEYKETRLKFTREKYKLGRKVIQIKDHFGLKAGRVGYIIRTGPCTTILFEDGRESGISPEICGGLKALDIYVKDVDLVERTIRSGALIKKRKM